MKFDTSCLINRKLPFPARCERFATLPVMKLSIPMTRCPSASKRSVRCEPRNPAAPVTTEMGLPFERVNMRGGLKCLAARASSTAIHRTRRRESLLENEIFFLRRQQGVVLQPCKGFGGLAVEPTSGELLQRFHALGRVANVVRPFHGGTPVLRHHLHRVP